MLRARSWLLEPPFFTVKVLRRLTGILEVPGISGDWEDVLGGLLKVGNHASNMKLRVEVQKVGFLVRTRLFGRGDNHMLLRRGPPTVSFLDQPSTSRSQVNIARIARLALLEPVVRDIKFKRIKFD